MNKIAVITGGAGGIGHAVAERLAREKQAVVILDVNDDAGAKVAAEFHKRGIPLTFSRVDVTQEPEVQSAFDKIKAEHGHIDVLVNVAGGSMHRHPLDEFPLAQWQAVIDTNLTSTFLCCRAATPIMKTHKSGAISKLHRCGMGSRSQENSTGSCRHAGRRCRSRCLFSRRCSKAHNGTNDPCERREDHDIDRTGRYLVVASSVSAHAVRP